MRAGRQLDLGVGGAVVVPVVVLPRGPVDDDRAPVDPDANAAVRVAGRETVTPGGQGQCGTAHDPIPAEAVPGARDAAAASGGDGRPAVYCKGSRGSAVQGLARRHRAPT